MSLFSRLTFPRKTLLLTTVGLCSATSYYASTVMQNYERAVQNPHDYGPDPTLTRRTENVLNSLVVSDRNIREGRTYTLLSHTLTHFDLTHFALNMVGLWSFGTPCLALFGTWAFAGLWIGAGITGGAAEVIWERRKKRDGRIHKWDPREKISLGASGSVLGVVTAVCLAVPKGSLWIFPVPFPIKSWMLIPGFAIYSFLADKYGWESGTGHLGHLGGMAFGGLAWLLLLRRRPAMVFQKPFGK